MKEVALVISRYDSSTSDKSLMPLIRIWARTHSSCPSVVSCSNPLQFLWRILELYLTCHIRHGAQVWYVTSSDIVFLTTNKRFTGSLDEYDILRVIIRIYLHNLKSISSWNFER